jgi:hypothetical protein
MKMRTKRPQKNPRNLKISAHKKGLEKDKK